MSAEVGTRLPANRVPPPPAVEAWIGPLAFLTVALLGGLRVTGAGWVFAGPPLVALVLATALLFALADGDLLAPSRFVAPHRHPLENASGVVLLASAFAASCQIFTLLLPTRGLLHGLFVIVMGLLLLSTMTARPTAPRLLRSLVVTLGGIFVAKFIVLGALYDPQAGWQRRLVTTLFEGVTLGSAVFDPPSAAEGYVGFLTLGLYLGALRLIAPPAVPEPRTHRDELRRPRD